MQYARSHMIVAAIGLATFAAQGAHAQKQPDARQTGSESRVKRPVAEPKPRVVRPTEGTSGPFRDMKVAMALLTKARVDAAKRLLEQITTKIPEHAEAWHLLATCYELKRDRRRAHENGRKALALSPEHARAALLLARIHKVDDARLAADYARQAEKNAAIDVVTRRSAARILMETGNLDEASAIVQQLAAKDPKGQRLLYLRAELALARRQFAEAREHYGLLARLRPHDPIPHENIAGILHNEGRLAQAIEALERALLVQPGKRSTRQRLIEFLVESGASEERIASERQALRGVPRGRDVADEPPRPRPRR